MAALEAAVLRLCLRKQIVMRILSCDCITVITAGMGKLSLCRMMSGLDIHSSDFLHGVHGSIHVKSLALLISKS